jgi:hypothetical protein
MKWLSWLVLLAALVGSWAYAEFQAGPGGVYFEDSTPGNTTYRLYNSGGSLYWESTELSSGG